jgi:hypothetical protein
LVTNVLLALLLVRWGAWGVALGFTVRAYCSIPFSFLLLRTATGLKVFDVLRAIVPSLASALFMAAVTGACLMWVLSPQPSLPRIIETIGIGMASYLLGLAMFGRRLLRDMHAEIAPILANLRNGTVRAPLS